MPLPTVTKTWQHTVNQRLPSLASQALNNARCIRTIKNVLTGFATLPWTVAGSSNGVAAGMDSVDRWVVDGNVIGAGSGTAHSWIVLKQSGLGTNVFICIDMNGNSLNALITVVMSTNAAFTGGSTTARPTSTTECVLLNQASWGGDQSGTTGVDILLHVQQSTDGQCTRVQTFFNNVRTGLWIFDRVQNAPTGWTVPVVGLVLGAATGLSVGVDSDLFSAANARGFGTTSFNAGFTVESNNTRLILLLAGPNDFDASYPLFPIGIVSTTASHRGRHGNLFDLWSGLVIVADRDTYPADTSRQFAQFGDTVFPWDGSVPVTF